MGSGKSHIGVIGLAVMGENLVLNMADKGFTVSVFNRTTARVDEFTAGRAAGKSVVGTHSIAEMVQSLAKPRTVMAMVKAGKPVDELISQLAPLMEPGDVIMDGGNSNYQDTARRVEHLAALGIHFVGTGVSGGEEGALLGPSIMPGGAPDAWPVVRPVLQAIAARTPDGAPCCAWIGGGGAGHYVKMIHNGIEYGDMQIIAEGYHLMREALGMDNAAMGEAFAGWNRGDLDSYLTEITGDILCHREADGSVPLDTILDVAGQKGTGKWTVTNALDAGQPLTLISEAVFARFLSSLKDERVEAARLYAGAKPAGVLRDDRQGFLADLEKALFAAKIASYAQGFELMRAGAGQNGWTLNYGEIALIWRAGCIIRSTLLGRIAEAYDRNAELPNLLLDPFFCDAVSGALPAWRRVVSTAVSLGIPLPAIGSALSYFEGYTSGWLPANMIQAQRDYFGAHTYERTDRPRGEFFHTNWTGRGGSTASSAYNA
jgi:6-phosphogluconate dehydrogenase